MGLENMGPAKTNKSCEGDDITIKFAGDLRPEQKPVDCVLGRQGILVEVLLGKVWWWKNGCTTYNCYVKKENYCCCCKG